MVLRAVTAVKPDDWCQQHFPNRVNPHFQTCSSLHARSKVLEVFYREKTNQETIQLEENVLMKYQTTLEKVLGN